MTAQRVPDLGKLDEREATDCVVELAGFDLEFQDQVAARAFGRARHILSENWETVADLAEALLAAGTLNRQQVAQLVKGE